MSRHPNIEIFKKLFRAHHNTLHRRRNLSILLIGSAILLGIVSLFVLLESLFFLSPAIKTGFWILAIAAALATGWWTAWHFTVPDFTTFYRSTADRIGLPGLRHVMDLVNSRTSFRSDLLDAAVKQNFEQLSRQQPDDKLTVHIRKHRITRTMQRAVILFGGALMLLVFVFIFLDDAFHRSSTFWISYQRPIPFEFTITPGDTTIEQGNTFQVAVHFPGDSPNQVRLGLRTEQESEYRLQGMSRSDDGTFKSRELELFEDADYFLEMDNYRSDLKHVRVELLPRLQDLVVSVHPPGYTGQDSTKHTYPLNRLEAPAGSRLVIQTRSNKPLEMLRLIAENSSDTLSLSPDTLITKEISATADERYHFEMRDSFGLANSNPFRFRLSVTNDLPPHVEILSPDSYVHDFVSESIPLLYEFEDDYGFTATALRYRLHKAFLNEPVSGSATLAVPNRTRGIAEYDWDVSDMGLGPLDRLEYWIEITDNNEIDGYQTTRSSTHIIEIPSLASRFFEQEEKEDQIDNRFSEVEDSYRRMQNDLDQLRESIRTNPDDDWEQSQLLDDIQDQRSEIEQQLEDLRREFEELTMDMESRDLMSEETVERYRELQQLMEEIDDPDILRMLKEMQENLSQFDQSQLREQLENISFNEERYRERLERTMELFKSLRLDSDLDRMSKIMEDLGQQEETLSRQEQYGEEELQRQEQIQEQMKELSEKMKQLPEKSPARRQEQMQQMSDELSQMMDDLDRRLEENIDKMQDGGAEPSELQQEQQDMSHDMEELSQQLSDLRVQMQQESISINLQALRYVLETLILLSDVQEDVAKRTSELTSNSPGFIEQARRQRNINSQFSMITDSLYRVSTEIPQFSNRINDRKREIERHMNRATQYLIDRNRSQATAQEHTSLGGLNEIGTMVADLLDQLNQMDDGDDGGQMSMQQMMEQMQEMSQDQQQLNQQIQDFINDMQGERLTQDHMERLEQMARQQNRIREQMKELQRSGGREGDRLMSEMERLAEEMEDAINDMRGGSTDKLMEERQHNILSRMLEVEESVHKRDEDEEQRLGKTAEEYEAREVPELTMEELRQKIRSGADQTHYTRFRDDYRRLIERYFQLMEETLEEPERF